MANEQNYIIKLMSNINKLMSNPNQVDECFMCPVCHNDDADSLIIKDDDTVTCLKCGNVYSL